ncbi:hypothetical protein T484DRAFT_1861770 [Baffinella frigidus]|nr:hypothetical protein T484DRAFT_1861770 [Cryptophyta sp. CCMP2293]
MAAAGWKAVIKTLEADEAAVAPALNPENYQVIVVTSNHAWPGWFNPEIYPEIYQVYDTGRITDPKGTTDFNNGAHMEPDVILEDYIKTMYPEVNKDHKFVWLRNMMKEGAGMLHKCADDAAKIGCSETGADLGGKCTDGNVLHMTKADVCSAAPASRASTLLSLLAATALALVAARADACPADAFAAPARRACTLLPLSAATARAPLAARA